MGLSERSCPHLEEVLSCSCFEVRLEPVRRLEVAWPEGKLGRPESLHMCQCRSEPVVVACCLRGEMRLLHHKVPGMAAAEEVAHAVLDRSVGCNLFEDPSVEEVDNLAIGAGKGLEAGS